MKHWAKLKQRLIQRDTKDDYLDKGIFKEVHDDHILYQFNKLEFEQAPKWPTFKIPHEEKSLSTEDIKQTLLNEIDNTGNI